MSEQALIDMGQDDRQILKEAICDAILERTRRVVSGSGAEGKDVLGGKPSRILSSGFILPRLDENGDDESSYIRLAAHGMDIRVRGNEGLVRVEPTFAIYVRVFPTADELFDRESRLVPRAELSEDATKRSKEEVERRMTAHGPVANSKERAALQARIRSEVYRDMGVRLPENALIVSDEDLPNQDREDRKQVIDARSRLLIPNRLSRQYEAPMKWHRLDVIVEPLELPLPVDVVQWTAKSDAYSAGLRLAINQTCVAFLATDEGKNWIWRRRRPESEDFWSPDAWNAFLEKVRGDAPVLADIAPQIDLQLLAQGLLDNSGVACHSVRFSLENVKEGKPGFEYGVFDVRLRIGLPDAALVPMRLERIKRSYHLAGFMNMPAIGVNGGVDDLTVSSGVRTLQTSWTPRYVLPRMAARSIKEVPTEYHRLSDPGLEVKELIALVRQMDDWRANVANNTDLSLAPEEGDAQDEKRQRDQFQRDVKAWEYEAKRVELGIEVLKRSRDAWQQDRASTAAIPYRAWLLLNKTFSRANPVREGSRAPGWRLFQLAFILAHIPTLASKIPEYQDVFRADFDEESVSLLYMSTGGGKTEAFFGTVVFGLFIDRLRGKLRGVTAMMHYPLRLLTVQQAQRLARLMAHAEMVRVELKVPGAPFEIGFWVGSGNTPNGTERPPGKVDDNVAMVPLSNKPGLTEEALLDGTAKVSPGYPAANAAWNKLPECPFCKSRSPTGLRLFPEEHHRLGIVCHNPDCDWNKLHSSKVTPLPFLLTDKDIYRRAPSVLLGTIDKLALIGQHVNTIDAIAGMFGMARSVEQGAAALLDSPVGESLGVIDGDARKPVAPAFSHGVELFHDPFPSLIVQDEMHLLEESLGTFGGIFETGLFAWFRRLAGILGTRASRIPGAPDVPRMPHIIGATATVSDAGKHARALYQLRVCQFPHPGPSLHSTFYNSIADFSETGAAADRAAVLGDAAASVREQEQAGPWGRVYSSIMTNGRLHTVTTISVLAAHAATITRWQRDLASADANLRDRAVGEIAECVTDQPYAAARREAVVRAGVNGRFDRLAQILDLHRIELTYVTNKKGGDQILSALNAEVAEAHEAMGSAYELSSFLSELISGGVDIGGIQKVIRAAEAPFDPMADDIADTLRLIVATSAISHGVDVEVFNSMAFAGMPSDIAEYIQASSRVGRTHVGFSLLIPTPQARRDRFVVEVHESFHRLLERMISPPAIERWADRAIERTVPSLVQTWLAGVYFQRAFAAAPSDKKQSVPFPFSVEQLARVLEDTVALKDCVTFIAEAIGVSALEGQSANPEYYADLVKQQLGRIRTEAATGNYTGQLSKFWGDPLSGMKPPMSSLRDVDAAGTIRSSTKVSSESFVASMAFIRNRSARRSASGELDRDE